MTSEGNTSKTPKRLCHRIYSRLTGLSVVSRLGLFVVSLPLQIVIRPQLSEIER